MSSGSLLDASISYTNEHLLAFFDKLNNTETEDSANGQNTRLKKDDFNDEPRSSFKPEELDELKKAFSKYDKKKSGSINPSNIADVFRWAGQNPTNHEASRMIELAEEPGTGMLSFSEMLSIIEKYWRSYENYADELKEACLAFDTNDTGLIDFEDMKKILLNYGDQLDEDEMFMFEKAVSLADGKMLVDEFIKLMSPLKEPKKKKSGKGKGKGGKGKKGKK